MNVRLTMLQGRAQEVILTDGEPPYRAGAPKFLKYVLARNEGQDLKSNYVSLLEAYMEKPVIRSVTDLRTKDDTWSDVAVRVELGGRTDFLFSSIAPKRSHAYPPGIRFRGSQAFVSQEQGRLSAACLIGSRDARSEATPILECFGARIEITGSLRGAVGKIDPDAGTFETEADALHPGLVGEIMILGNAVHKCAYRVTGLKNLGGARWRVELEADFILGISPLKQIKGQTAQLIEEITTYKGRFAGMTLSNEDGSSLWKIESSNMKSVTVPQDGPPLEDAAFKDIDGDLERCLKVCDFGPGDEWFIPASAHLTRKGDEYVIRTNAPARMTLPDRKDAFKVQPTPLMRQ